MLITQYSTPLQRQVTEQHSRRGKLRDWPGSHETVSEQGAITLLKTNQAAIDELVVTTASIWPMNQYTAQLSNNEPHTDTHTHGHTDTHSDIDMTDTFSSYVHDETVQVCTAGKVADPTRWDVLAATAETIKYKQTNNSTHLEALDPRRPARASTKKTFIHLHPAVLVIIQQLQLTLSISHGSQHLPWTVVKQVNLF